MGIGTIRSRVYHKDTHTDQYLNFSSNHPRVLSISGEKWRPSYTVLRLWSVTWMRDRRRRITLGRHWVSMDTLTGCWKRHEKREADKEGQEETVEVKPVKTPNKSRKSPVVLPYIRGFSEELRRVFGAFGVPTYFKPTNTLRQLLVRP